MNRKAVKIFSSRRSNFFKYNLKEIYLYIPSYTKNMYVDKCMIYHFMYSEKMMCSTSQEMKHFLHTA